jgi:hypothetical protein
MTAFPPENPDSPYGLYNARRRLGTRPETENEPGSKKISGGFQVYMRKKSGLISDFKNTLYRATSGRSIQTSLFSILAEASPDPDRVTRPTQKPSRLSKVND